MPIEHEAKPLRLGCKRVDVTLVIHTYEDVPEDWNEGNVQFFVEENHCLGNYLTRIQADEERGEPPHVHVERDDRVGKFWLAPVRLSDAGGLGPADLRRASLVIREHEQAFLERFRERTSGG